MYTFIKNDSAKLILKFIHFTLYLDVYLAQYMASMRNANIHFEYKLCGQTCGTDMGIFFISISLWM